MPSPFFENKIPTTLSFQQQEAEYERQLRSQMEPIYMQKLQQNSFQKDELVRQFNMELKARMDEWKRNIKGKQRINENIQINQENEAVNRPGKYPRIEQQEFVPGPSKASVMGNHIDHNNNKDGPFRNEQEVNIHVDSLSQKNDDDDDIDDEKNNKIKELERKLEQTKNKCKKYKILLKQILKSFNNNIQKYEKIWYIKQG